MLDRLLALFFRLSLFHRRKVFLAFALLVPLSLALAFFRLTISTSQSALLNQDHPVQREYAAFAEEFGALDALVAVVHGGEEDAAMLLQAADALAPAFEREADWVRNVFYRVDPAPFESRALWFAPQEALQAASEKIGGLSSENAGNALAAWAARDGLGTEADALNLKGFVSALGDFAASALRDAPPASGRGEKMSLAALPQALGFLTAFSTAWDEAISDDAKAGALPDFVHEAIAASFADRARASGRTDAGAPGYLTSRDGRMVFLFIQPKELSDEASHLRPFLDAMRRAADGVLASNPEFSGRVQVGFTGSPAHILTEAETVFSDVARGVLGAVILMIAVIFFGFRTLKKTLALFVPLLSGMALSLGAVSLTVGRLNLISAAFFAVMFGMGMDFGIYLVRRAEEELGRGEALADAVRIALTRTGKGVFVGALTTCAAFWGTSLTDFAGFSELGMTAGMGILCCLISVFLLTPGMMLSLGMEPAQARTDALEKRMTSGGAHRVLKFSALVLTLLLLLSLGSLSRAHFDDDALKLLPKDSESTVLQHRMQEESDLAANSAMVVSDSLIEARRVTARLRLSGEVSRVESLSDLLPEDQEEKARLLSKLDGQLSALWPRYRAVKSGGREGTAAPISESETESESETSAAAAVPPALDELSELAASLERLSEILMSAEEAAFASGASGLASPLEKAVTALEKLSADLKKLPESQALERTHAFERRAADALNRSLASLSALLSAPPLTEGDLSAALLSRFKSPRGRYAVYVFPRSLVWDLDALDRFMAAVRAESPRVTGFAATHQVFARMVPKSFAESMAFAALFLVLMLFFDFRRPFPVAMALVPAALGMLLLQSLLELFGVDHNYASIAAYPVLLGYGSDYGVNVVHRWLERPSATAFVASATAGKGVLLSAATSAAGLCSIVFARHKGVSDFGAVLLLGIAVSFVTAVVFLPALIDFLKRPAEPLEPH